jgi:hypothetical protein
MHEMLTIAFGDNVMVEHRLLSGFLTSNLRKLGGENCVEAIFQVAQMKMWKKVYKSDRRPMNHHFLDAGTLGLSYEHARKFKGEKEHLPSRVITGDKPWIYCYKLGGCVMQPAATFVIYIYIYHKNYTIIKTVRYTTSRAWCSPPTSI